MSGVILVTRTQPGAAAQAEALRAAGFEARLCPVLEIECRDPDASISGAFDAFFFMSTHAVRCGLGHVREHIGGAPCFAVGAATANALRAQGVTATRPAGGESTEGLLALPQLQRLEGSRIAIVRGEGGREKLAAELEARGARVACIDVYRRVRAKLGSADLARVEQVIIGSGDGLRAFADLVGHRRDVELIVPSQRVAEMARELGFERLLVSDGASDDAVISCLRSRGPHG